MNSLFLHLATYLALLVGGGAAFAQQLSSPSVPSDDPTAEVVKPVQPHGWNQWLPRQTWLGLGLAHSTYSEPGIMQLRGFRRVLSLQAEWAGPSDTRLEWQGLFDVASMNYSSELSGQLDRVPDVQIDQRLLWVIPTQALHSHAIAGWRGSALLGMGYRYNYNDLRGTTTQGHVGYRRINHRIYSPVGIEFEDSGQNDSHGGRYRFLLMPSLSGRHVTVLGDVGGTPDGDVSQRSMGWSIEGHWPLSSRFHLEAYHQTWKTQQTSNWIATRAFDGTKAYYEPDGLWQEVGVRLIGRFK